MKPHLYWLAVLATAAGINAHAHSLDSEAARKVEYEYIVVGSGPGGGPLAANLARRGHKVLLLEAGDDQGLNLNQTVPAFGPKSSEDETMSWGFFVKHFADPKTAAQDSKMAWDTPNGTVHVGLDPPAGSTQKGLFYPRASTIGGCASHNALISILPPASDWEYIAKITGDSSWSPESMQRYFERLERCLYLPKGTPGHGFQGWLETELQDSIWQESNTDILKPALDFVRQTTIKADINAPHGQDSDGAFSLPLTMNKKGRRAGVRNFVVATANARNKDGSKKYPLYVKTHAFVTKVLFDSRDGHYPPSYEQHNATNATSFSHFSRRPGNPSKPRAVGVEYVEGQSLYKADPRANPRAAPPTQDATKQVRASREVVVAGGAFNTPQILKLSGIGPAAELRRFGIPVLVDLPGVGANLQDNYEYSVVGRSPQVVSPLLAAAAQGGKENNGMKNGTDDDGDDDAYLAQWRTTGTGPYKGDGIEVAMLHRTRFAGTRTRTKTAEPDLLLYSTPLYFTGFFPGYAANVTAGDGHAHTWVVLKFRQEDRAGTVTLRSANPFDAPDINFEFFAEDKDTDRRPTTRADDDDAHVLLLRGRGGGNNNNNNNNKNNDGQHDLDVMAEGVRLVRGFSDAVAGPKGPIREVLPGDQVTDAQLRRDIKHNAFSHHAAGTCAIGGDHDGSTACLDGRFRVRGVEGLRVVDASVFPRVPGSFPQLPVYMVSEKAVDVLLEDAAGFAPPPPRGGGVVDLGDATFDSLREGEVLVSSSS